MSRSLFDATPNDAIYKDCLACTQDQDFYCANFNLGGALADSNSCIAVKSDCNSDVSSSFESIAISSPNDCNVFEPLPEIDDCFDCVDAGFKMCVGSARSVCVQTWRNCDSFTEAGVDIKEGERTTALSCALDQSTTASIIIVTAPLLLVLAIGFCCWNRSMCPKWTYCVAKDSVLPTSVYVEHAMFNGKPMASQTTDSVSHLKITPQREAPSPTRAALSSGIDDTI